MLSQIHIGTIFVYEGKKYKVLSSAAPTIKAQRYDDDLEIVEFNLNMLLLDGSVKFQNSSIDNRDSDLISDLDAISDEKRDDVSKKIELIRPLILYREGIAGNKRSEAELINKYPSLYQDYNTDTKLTLTYLVKQIANMNNVSERTIWKYWHNWNLYNTGGLISKQGSGVNSRTDNNLIEIRDLKDRNLILQQIPTRLKPDQINIIEDVIAQYYLNERKASVQEIIDIIEIQCNKKNPSVKVLKKSTIYNIIKKIDPKLSSLKRDGIDYFEDKYNLVQSGYSNEAAMYPLHIIEIDHTLIDEDILDNTGKYIIGRPWITLGIDVYSRMPWCFYLSFEAPSANVVRKAIINGVLPKRIKETLMTENDWNVWGIPSIIYTDNGSSFDNAQLKRIVDDVLLSELRKRPVKIPRYGAVIERYFGTINTTLIHRLYGTRKSNISELGAYEPEHDACLTLSALKEILLIYLTDIYPFQVHSGLPKETPIPALRYKEGLEKSGFPRFITPGEENKFVLGMIPELNLSITREGIQHNNIKYNSYEIKHLVMGRTRKYRVKIDPDDISFCLVFDEKSSRWLKVYATSPNFAEIKGMNQYTWKKVYKEMINLGKKKIADTPGANAVSKAKERIYDKVNEEYKKSRTIRKQRELLTDSKAENIIVQSIIEKSQNNSRWESCKGQSLQVNEVNLNLDGDTFGFRVY